MRIAQKELMNTIRRKQERTITYLVGVPHSWRVLTLLLALIVFPLCAESYAQDNGRSEGKSVETAETGGRNSASEQAPISFTSAQASKGRTAYRTYCAACHGPKLEGIGLAPSLVGTRFDRSWRGKSMEVLAFHMRRMPPEGIPGHGSLSVEAHTNMLAYILRSNDFAPGDVKLSSNVDAIRALTVPRLEGSDYDPDAPVVASAAQTALLNNLPAVTNEMLNSPPASDWLMWGRTRDMQNFSPLKEIDKENVSHLNQLGVCRCAMVGVTRRPWFIRELCFCKPSLIPSSRWMRRTVWCCGDISMKGIFDQAQKWDSRFMATRFWCPPQTCMYLPLTPRPAK